ncbi:MAG: tetratricopeptide repeat protein, partial [Acidobacteriota bacterium]
LEQGRAADALAFYRQAVDMAEVSLGSESPALALLLHELGTVFRQAGDLGRAEEQLRRALGLFEQTLGPEHPEQLATLSDLADLISQRGEPGQAQPLYQRLVSILRATRPPGDADTVAALGQLALSLDQQQRASEAESIYEIALEEGSRGEDSIELATVLNNLATFRYRQGQAMEAEPLFRRAAALRARLLGERHWLVAVSHADLAKVVSEVGDRAEALRLADRALDALEPYCGGLSAQAPGESRSLQELCSSTRALRERLTAPAREPEPQPVGLLEEGAPGPVFRAQLMSQENLEQAQAELARLEELFRDLLAGRSGRIESVDLGIQGRWHRLQFGDFARREGAETLCRQLRTRGWRECWVVEADAAGAPERR